MPRYLIYRIFGFLVSLFLAFSTYVVVEMTRPHSEVIFMAFVFVLSQQFEIVLRFGSPPLFR